MRLIILSLALLFTSNAAHSQILSTKIDSVSYALGAMIVKSMKQQGITEVNTDFVAMAIQDALEGKQVLLYPDEAQLCLTNYVNQLKNAEKSKNIKEAEMFLAENAKREGVTVLPSGLQYEVLKNGDGLSPGPTNKVRTHYHGTLIDGTVFDSSVERNEPISFPVNGVIKGWQEALQLMKVGDKWRLYVPSDLAYGSRGAGGVIGPDAALIFEVELLAIEK